MADAKKCDRCGNFYTLDISNEEDNIVGFSFLDKCDRRIESLDLCVKCRKTLMQWMKEGVDNDQN